MSEVAAKYWAARCRRGDPPAPGSPCAALLWAVDEIEMLRRHADRLGSHVGERLGAGRPMTISAARKFVGIGWAPSFMGDAGVVRRASVGGPTAMPPE